MNPGSFVSRWRNELFAGVTGGFLLALSFPPFPTRFLSAVALVPIFRYFIVFGGGGGCGGKRAAGGGGGAQGEGTAPLPLGNKGEGWKGRIKSDLMIGFSFGIAFFLTLLYWVANLIPESGARMPYLLIPGLILLVLYLSCYTAGFSLALSFLVRRFGCAALFAAPALWSLTEFARSRGELGFSWGVISYSVAIYPRAIQGLSFYGPFGLSLVLVLINVLFTLTLFSRSKRWRVCSLAALAIITASHLLWGSLEIARFDREMKGRIRESDVAVIQPNLDLGIKWNPAYRDSIFRQIEDMTVRSADRGARIVIFPETAAPVAMSHSPQYRQWLRRISREAGVDLLIGYIDHSFEDGEWCAYNSAGLFNRQGMHTRQYSKVNLLPFGERIPFSQYIPALSRLNFGQANFKAGEISTLFHSGVGKFGVLICFESIFSHFTRRYVRDGAHFLVNITNDGWFGSRRGPIQHAEMAILRSVENRVTLLRAANTGISMVVDPVGRVRQHIGLDREGIMLDSIYPAGDLTVYCRYGHLPFFVMILVSLAIVPLLSTYPRRTYRM